MKIETLADLVFQVLPHYNKSSCLMVKRDGAYRSISSNEVRQNVEALAAEMIHLGVQKGDRIGLLSENRPEWAYADLANICCGAITVPIYGTLPAKQIAYIINDSEMEILFISNAEQLRKITEIRAEVPRLKKLILFEGAGAEVLEGVMESGRRRLEDNREIVSRRAAEIQPDDVLSIVYTSGTTGEPKGVMLTHRNVLSNIEAVRDFFPYDKDESSLSFLPLSHIFERMAGYYAMLYQGCTIAYAESVEMLRKNLLEVRPTILMSVPRVYEKFYAAIMDNVAAEQGIKKKLLVWALRVADQYSHAAHAGKVPSSLRLRHKLADALVLRKIRARLGGRLHFLVSGGAALPKQLAFFFFGLGLKILEGYGLTETSPVIAVNRPNQFRFGTVGPAIPGIEVKIAEDGEILTRGPHIMKGYYKKPKQTDEVIDGDGWFHSGDIGEFHEGFLRITDRKKDLIVTSAGKNIAPQFIENTLKTCRYISQIVVVGDKRKFPSALIVPNKENLGKLANEMNIPQAEMFRNERIRDEVQKEIERLSTNLASFERVKKIALLEHEFTIESGELTPSLKIKRSVVEKRYKEVIDALYSEPSLV